MDGRALRLRHGLALLAALAALGLLALRPWLRQPSTVPPSESSETATAPRAAAGAPATLPGAAHDDAVRAKVAELQALSETFRNTTFLIAIRDASFKCDELRGVYGGQNDSHTWTATCSEMLSYTVRVAGDGGLVIEPTLQYFDGLLSVPVPEGDLPLRR
jgi:hypothetical protein